MSVTEITILNQNNINKNNVKIKLQCKKNEENCHIVYLPAKPFELTEQ